VRTAGAGGALIWIKVATIRSGYRLPTAAATMSSPSARPSSGPISGDRFGALFAAAVDPIVLIDREGRITGFNLAAEQVFGWREADVLGERVSILMPGPYRDEHDGYMSRYLGTGQRRIIGIGREVVARRRDGSTFPIDLSVGEFVSGAEHGFVGILRDITARKAQEAELRRTTEELRLIFEQTPTALALLDAEGCIVDVNRACESLLGRDADALRGRRHGDLLADADRALVEGALSEVIAGRGETWSRDVQYLRGDGRPLPALLHAGVARDVEGRPLLAICEIVDRSQLFEATREAEDLRTRLAHVARIGTLGEMVSGIAHEVNQPLTAIANYANAARRFVLAGDSDPAELAGILDKIAAQAERAGQVIRGLRNLTRRRDAVREPLDCAALIAEVARLVEFELRARGWRLLTRIDGPLPPVYGDGVQIQQVLLNLIRNGIEAMAEAAQGDVIEVLAEAVDGSNVEIRVRDRGPGLRRDVEDHLFEPFFTTKAQGMGLGLSICKSLMRAHDGDLRYQPGRDGGAEFIMRLPAAMNREEARDA
jgi:two-component system sensor kinase FixL